MDKYKTPHKNQKDKKDINIYKYMCMYVCRAGNRRICMAKYKSLWSTDLPYFWVTVNNFWPIANHFLNRFAKNYYIGPHPFFREILYIKSKSMNQLQIMISKLKK